jgi:hypothetical protein
MEMMLGGPHVRFEEFPKPKTYSKFQNVNLFENKLFLNVT